MKYPVQCCLVLACALVAVGCGDKSAASAAPAAGDGSGKPAEMIKLSQFGHAGWCAIDAGADGTIHALFTDFKEYGKPAHLYYRASTDDGVTWSDAKLVSDDEEPASAGPCRVIVDGSGKVYAIWKYINPNELLEGPNGPALGTLNVRVLEGGNWSKVQTFGDEHKPMTSFFAALGPDKKLNIVYSRADDAVDWKGRGMPAKNANNIDQLVFDGSAAPQVTHLIVARHVPTEAEQKAAHDAGKSMTYEETQPADTGLWNLNGYIAADGKPRFLCEGYQTSSQTPQAIQYFDGTKVATFTEYKKYLGYNTFNWPPTLVLAAGKEHVLRKPETSENEVLRDYVVDAGKPGEKTDVVTNESPKATISGWWSSGLANDRIAAMAAVAPNVDVLGATDLYVSLFDGKGAWTKPMNVTDNAAREKFAAAHGVSQSTSYLPKYAAAVTLKDGSVGVIMLNAEHVISGIDTVGITDGGRAVTGTSSFSVEEPYVTFTKVKG